MSVFLGQRLSHDFQHISPSLVVDGARSWLPGNSGAGLSHGPWRPSCHHCVWVSPWLPVHRSVEFSDTGPAGCMYLKTNPHKDKSYMFFKEWFPGVISEHLLSSALWFRVCLLCEQSLPGWWGQLWVFLSYFKACWSSCSAPLSRSDLLMSHYRGGFSVSDPWLLVLALILLPCLNHTEHCHRRGFPMADLSSICGEHYRCLPEFSHRVSVCLPARAGLSARLGHLCVWMGRLLRCPLCVFFTLTQWRDEVQS